MSEEVELIENEPAKEEVSSNVELAESKKSGYMSKEEWVAAGKPEADYVSKEEFDRRGPIFDYIKEQKAINKDLLRQLTNVSETIQEQKQKAEQEGYNRALQDIQGRLKSAVEFGDVNLANQYATELSDLRSKAPVVTPKPPEYVEDFKRNKLHIDDKNLTPESYAVWQYAVAEAANLGAANPNRSHLEMMAEIELKAKDMFPNYFKKFETASEAPRKAPSLASSHNNVKKPEESDSGSLTPAQQMAFEYAKEAYEKHSGKKYTVKQYLETIKNTRHYT